MEYSRFGNAKRMGGRAEEQRGGPLGGNVPIVELVVRTKGSVQRVKVS